MICETLDVILRRMPRAMMSSNREWITTETESRTDSALIQKMIFIVFQSITILFVCYLLTPRTQMDELLERLK
jgi:hypothetical protein